MVKDDFAAFNMTDRVILHQSKTTLTLQREVVGGSLPGRLPHQTLARETVGPCFLDAVARSERSGDHLLAVITRNEFSRALELPVAQWNLRIHSSGALHLFPNVEIIIHPDYISHMTFFPTAVDETVVVRGGGFSQYSGGEHGSF